MTPMNELILTQANANRKPSAGNIFLFEADIFAALRKVASSFILQIESSTTECKKTFWGEVMQSIISVDLYACTSVYVIPYMSATIGRIALFPILDLRPRRNPTNSIFCFEFYFLLDFSSCIHFVYIN
jgi:hypothetical protein